ncbi:MAG: DUF87 domain-containing protein [Candidatus Zixiibacteriota bacterium]
MNAASEKEFNHLLHRAHQLGLNRNRKFSGLLSLLKTNPADTIVLNLLQEMISEVEVKNLEDPNPFRLTNPNNPLFEGSIFLGNITDTKIPYLISPELLTTHMLISGKTGGGKSNLILLTLLQLIRHHTIKIFDRKFEYHCLLAYENFVYWMLKDFFINLIEPSLGVAPRLYINTFCEILGIFLDIRVAARGLLAATIQKLCENRDSYSTGVYPTLKDVYIYLCDKKYPLMSRNARYQESIINRLDSLFCVFGNQINSQRKLDWNQFLTTNWAISLNGIPTDYQNLFITIIIAKIMMYRIHNNLRSNQLVDLFVFDEASTIFKKYYDNREQTFLLTDYLAQAREFGSGFLISTQGLTNISNSVLTNTSLKIMTGGQGMGTDFDIFASATGMNTEQREFIRQMTQPGKAVVRDPRYPYPFTLEVPKIV